MEGDKSTDNSDDYYKNVKLVGFVKTDSETLSGYKNDGFQWSSADNLSSYPSSYHRENDIISPSEYYTTQQYLSIIIVHIIIRPYKIKIINQACSFFFFLVMQLFQI
jgi:hypothetical protein